MTVAVSSHASRARASARSDARATDDRRHMANSVNALAFVVSVVASFGALAGIVVCAIALPLAHVF